ncbi:MAG: hypothetical protein ACK4SZ_06130 [Allosphingosinicella sp.]|uniref:hypothetical protein n=1 Tax=Allosphingosinicella sp. TaxID=2823234 RepID=UPI003939F836
MKFMKLAIKLHDSFAVHPGLWLHAEIVEPAGLSVANRRGRKPAATAAFPSR